MKNKAPASFSARGTGPTRRADISAAAIAELRANSNRIFDRAFAAGKDKSSRALWFSKRKQLSRFAEILHFIDPLDRSILDVGCGNGMFAEFLHGHGFRGRYTGIDINRRLLAEARRDYPGFDFAEADILSKRPRPHDCVVMSGALNANFGQNMDFVFEFIKGMWGSARRKVVFNAISGYVNFRDERLFYIPPCEVIDFAARNLSPKFEIRHSFVPFNYTMCIHRTKRGRTSD